MTNDPRLPEPAHDPADELPREEVIEAIVAGLPAMPGVYLMKDGKGKVIYVGKAVSLRSRVRSYFRDSGDQRMSVQFLRGRVADIETIVTDTEKEALLLENLLIKKHKPRYNVRLRDDKTYISLRLDVNHQWPRVHRIRRRIPGDKALYFGPYSSSGAVKETLRFLQKLFPLRSCPDHILTNRTRPCILHQIDRCCAPCVGKADPEDYAKFVDQTKLFLNGKRDEVVDLLRRKMDEYSEELLFEKAAQVRDKIRAIERTVEQEKVASHRAFDRDVIAFAREAGHVVFMVFAFRAGNLEGSRPYDLRDPGLPDGELMEAFLTQLYDVERASIVPRDILTLVEPANGDLIRRALEELRGGAVRLRMPQRGEKARLVDMARRNAALELERRLAGEKSREQVLRDLQRGLKLPREPRRIECFDISNFQGSFTVASMTCFISGEPDKSQYRRFKIRSVEGQNDFASMQEALTRRFTRALREETELPDLLVIDGGKGQLNIAVEVLEQLGLLGQFPVCGLAKARLRPSKQGTRVQIRTEERVFLPNRKLPVVFDQSDPALFILTRIRDEAHRFGVEYHRKLRSKANLRTGLEEIPGVGPKKRKALLMHFGSLLRIREASEEELAQVQGINATLAGEIWQFLHQENPQEELARGPGEDAVAEEEAEYGEEE